VKRLSLEFSEVTVFPSFESHERAFLQSTSRAKGKNSRGITKGIQTRNPPILSIPIRNSPRGSRHIALPARDFGLDGDFPW
jgi:hypothetical protein